MRMTVDIVLTDGRRLTGRADKARGHPRKPMSRGEIAEKFRDCAALVMAREQAEQLLAHLWEIRSIDRVPDLSPMLVGRAA
jgi:2-methylcitrate dehydratase PrpD